MIKIFLYFRDACYVNAHNYIVYACQLRLKQTFVSLTFFTALEGHDVNASSLRLFSESSQNFFSGCMKSMIFV
jgi:hypothetical protein